MSADYRNLLISRSPIDWNELKFYQRNLYAIYKMKISGIHFYFIHTDDYNVFDNNYLSLMKCDCTKAMCISSCLE